MPENSKPRFVRGRVVLPIAAAVVAAAGLGWAGATVLTPPPDVLASQTHTYVEVTNGEVGSSLSLNTVAEWIQSPLGSNQAAGVVTSIDVEPGQEVDAGGVLYTVALRPTVVAQGTVPAFRSLHQGDSGPDVGQLQTMLASLGHYTGTVDSTFRWSTTAAVKAWQRTLGIAADGVVRASDVVFVPALPARVALDPELIEVGATLSGGEKIVHGLSSQPQFAIPATAAQAALMALGTRVEISGPEGGVWEAFVTGREEGDNGESLVHLEGADEAPICGDECARIPVTGQTFLASRVVIVEPVTGLVVPTAAIRSSAGGALSVMDDAGTSHDVRVVTTAKGMSLIEGVPAGLRVRVPASGS